MYFAGPTGKIGKDFCTIMAVGEEIAHNCDDNFTARVHIKPNNSPFAFLVTGRVFSRLFGYGLFFVQFIDFVYNSDLGSQLSKKHANVRVPPAPHKLLTESNVQLLDTNKCPLCLQRRRNDTALSVSGYVFCYSCIDSHVKSFKT
ncbi:unnamed protein product [Nippostrongylus brasiliensis]|uniref:Putative peroxisome assembly protein 12 (inferred by orthology to a C. elegans protein) n=1 Tax=Nippostrongylus brasiliensis TaxID=27835 RepID=A0A158QYR5_NIPBR|nr:unnamed protein product [Nippostrongylus brasiliensis]